MRRTFAAVISLAVLFLSASVRAGWLDKVKRAAQNTVDNTLKTRDERRTTQSTKSHAAVRGLGEDEADASGQDPRDFAGLEWLESLEISEEEVDRFVAEGGLAP